MTLESYISFLDQVTDSQRAVQRFHLIFSVAMVVLGISAIALAQLMGAENLKWLVTMGGTFVSTLAGFPLKELFKRRDRISALVFLKREFQRLSKNVEEPNQQELERYTERFWKFVDTTLGG